MPLRRRAHPLRRKLRQAARGARLRRERDGAVQGADFAAIDKGVPDGIRCDALGNVWSSAGDGVQIFDGSGARIGRILLPETAANLAFGGPDGRTVYITASSSLYAVDRLPR